MASDKREPPPESGDSLRPEDRRFIEFLVKQAITAAMEEARTAAAETRKSRSENLIPPSDDSKDQGMSRVRTPRESTDDRLSWKQICKRYRDEYVLLVEIDWTDENHFEFRDARVIGHAKHRHECLVNARENGRDSYKSIGFYWTGPIRALPRFIHP